MASNFDFLKEVDVELFEIIEDSQKLFRDEYFNQSVINTRIFAETMAKKIYGKNYFNNGIQMTFDDILNSLKDDIKTQADKEMIDDMFFIKKEGNNCAHGETITGDVAYETIKRAFEISINYANKKGHNYNNLEFDSELLITQKQSKPSSLVDKYVELATLNEEKQELLNKKQAEFLEKEKQERQFDKEVGNFEDLKKNKKKKELTPTQKRVKSRIKDAKKELKNTINKSKDNKTKKASTKTKTKSKKQSKKKDNTLKNILFIIFTIIALILLSKFFI